MSFVIYGGAINGHAFHSAPAVYSGSPAPQFNVGMGGQGVTEPPAGANIDFGGAGCGGEVRIIWEYPMSGMA